MNTTFKISSLMILFFISIGFTSCKKDNPVPAVNQEEFDKTVLTFVELEANGNQLVEHGTALTVTFDAKGKPDKSHYHLTVGKQYRLNISLYSGGELINDEIIEETSAHQIFFTGAPEDVLNYTYEDNIGLKGVLNVLKETETFDLSVILRHGIRKTNPLLPWNSNRAEYTKHGGSDDLNVTFKLHPVEDGEHDH